MAVTDRTLRTLRRRLPPAARRRLGRIRRAVLDLPEPEPPRTWPAFASPAPPPGRRIEVRRRHIFATAPRTGQFLEIGAAQNPTLPRRDGFNTRNVDHLDRQGLYEKYKDHALYTLDDYEEVDYVLAAGSTFSEAIDEHFDVVLASHVLEHSISLIDFVNDLAALIAPGGQLSLVVPDHRFCFDRFRERSSLARVVEASVDPGLVHSPGTLAEFALNATTRRNTIAWGPRFGGRYQLMYDAARAREDAEAASGEDYIDVHNWIFSPHHLRLLLDDLANLGLIRLRESYFHTTVGHEFYLNLTHDGAGSGLSREELLVRADAERSTLDVPVFRHREGDDAPSPAT